MSIAEAGTPPEPPFGNGARRATRATLDRLRSEAAKHNAIGIPSACRQLPADDHGAELGRRNLARRILAHVDRGERDVRRLAYLSARDVPGMSCPPRC